MQMWSLMKAGKLLFKRLKVFIKIKGKYLANYFAQQFRLGYFSLLSI